MPKFRGKIGIAWETSNNTFIQNMNKKIQIILNLLLTGTVIVAVVYLIINGIKFITANGDAGKTKEAMKGIQYAVIGLVVAFLSYILVSFVLDKIGVGSGTEDL